MPAPFSPIALRQRLASFPAALRAAVSVAAGDDVRWKPGPEHWSILEICWHMADEEVEDFRPRAALTLRDPSAAWPRLDLAGVAEVRRYNDRELEAALRAFESARRANVDWLGSLPPSTDWARAHVHPKFGPLAAGMLLASWAAHDALHLRQVSKRLHQMAARDAGEWPVAYAGEW